MIRIPLVFAWCVFVSATLPAADTIAKTAKAIGARLDKTSSVEFSETSLADALADIAETAGVNIILDKDVPRDKAITLTMKDASLRNILRWTLKLGGVHARVENEAIFVSDKKRAGPVVVAVYPIADILSTHKSRHPPGDDEDDAEDEVVLSRKEKAEQLLKIIKKIADTAEG